MIRAAYRAIGDLLSPELRSVLLKAIGLTIGLFILLFATVQVLLQVFTQFDWPWADWVLGIGTGAALLLAFLFLMSPVTAAFAGLYLDDVAARVERRHYPADPPGRPLPTWQALLTSVQFAVVVLVVNLAVLPTVLLGIGAVGLVAANAYLLSREYFEMAASRHMTRLQARDFRRKRAPAVFVAGFLPALAALIPFGNVLVPLFATSYFVHLFKTAQASSP